MKYKVIVSLIALSLLTVSVSAQNSSKNNQTNGIGPGLVGAGSPLYGLETAWDNAAVNVGLKKAGTVAQERAAEAKQAQERGNTKGVKRATKNLQKIANKSKESDEAGLNKAMQTMEEVIASAPNDQARQGMQTALENMKKAQDKRSEAKEQDRRPGNASDISQENRTENRDRMERGQSGDREQDSVNSTGNITQEEREREERNETNETQKRSTGSGR